MKKLIFLSLLLSSLTCFSGDLAYKSKVVEVANTSNNDDLFAVRLSGGTSVCKDSWVLFPASKFASDASFKQAFAIALAALMSGKEVRIHNYSNDSCDNASFISIYAQ